MDDLSSFLKKKTAPKPTVPLEGWDEEGLKMVGLTDHIDSRGLLKYVSTVGSKVFYFATAKDLLQPAVPKHLEVALRAAGEFDENPRLAFIIFTNTGMVPTRKSFFMECGANLTARTPTDLFEQLRSQAQRRGYEYKMVSEDAYDQLRCTEAFIDRDYGVCVRCGVLALQTGSGAPIALMTPIALVTLISLQRLDQTDKALRLAAQLRPALTADPWAATLVQLTLGEVELPEVLSNADNDQRLYQAHFYAGARFNTLGRIEEARASFAKCASIPADCLENCFVDSEVYEPPRQ